MGEQESYLLTHVQGQEALAGEMRNSLHCVLRLHRFVWWLLPMRPDPDLSGASFATPRRPINTASFLTSHA